MRIGIRLHDTVPGSLRERLIHAREQGFCCAHLALSKAVPGFRMEDAPKLLTGAFADEVRETFEQEQMECTLLGCYLQLTQPEGEERDRIHGIYRAHLRAARRMGAVMVGTETSGGSLKFGEAASRSEDAFRLFLSCLRPLVRCAEEEDTFLAVEPVFCDIVSTPERAERMLEEIGSDRLAIVLDAVNLLSNEDALNPAPVVEEAIRRLGDRVMLLHMKDFLPAPEKARPLSLPCGHGQMRYEALLRFAGERNLPMTLEDTRPENAEAARLLLENTAAGLA